MKSKKGIIVLAGIAIVVMGIFVAWLFRDFDAQGYMRAVLDQNFKGKTGAASDFVKDKSEKELQSQYEEGIRTFVENNITSGIEMEEELKQQYTALCKKIFSAMEYDVKGVEKVSNKEYHVSVEYRATDVFQKFTVAVTEESTRLMEKVNKGEYKGTLEEINEQMQKEFLENCYTLFETAFEEMQYAEAETEVFVIKRNSEGLFEIDDAQMNDFVKKIMGLDTNQD